MDFLFEFLFQIIFEVIGEALLEYGFSGASRVVRSRIGRWTVSVIVGFGFGAYWGHYLSEAGVGHRPRLLWVSVALAVFAVICALARSLQVTDSVARRHIRAEERALLPWQWPAVRLVGFAAMNIAIAVGIAVAYQPPIPG
jgi:hypothetical protein